MYKVFLCFYRHKWIAALLLTALIGLSIPGLKKVQFRINIRRILLSTQEKNTGEYVINTARPIIVRIQAKQDTVANRDFLSSLRHLVKAIKKKDSKVHTWSVFTVETLENRGGGFGIEPLLLSSDLAKINLEKVKAKIRESKYILDSYVSKDLKTTTIFIEYFPKNVKQVSDQYLSIESVIHSYQAQFKSIVIMSPGKTQALFFSNAKSQLPLLFLISFFMLFSLIIILTKNIRATCIVFFIVLVNLCFSFSVLGYMGWPINVMSIVLPFLILILGVTESIHLICGYLKGLKQCGQCHISSLKFMIDKVYFSSILTVATTSLGFYSFFITKSLALREFSLEGGTAMLICGLVTLFFTPLFLTFLPPKVGNKKNDADVKEKVFSHKIVDCIIKNSRLLLFIVMVVFVSSLYLSLSLKTDLDLFNPFVKTHPYSGELSSFRNNFGGMLTMTVKVKAPHADDMLRSDILKKLSAFSKEIKGVSSVSSVYSFADFIKNFNLKIHSNQKKYYRVPSHDSTIEQLMFMINARDMPELINEDLDQATINVRFQFLSLSQTMALENKIKKDFKLYFGDQFQLAVSHVMQENILSLNLMTTECFWSILICLLTIFLLFCIQFHSVISGLIAIFSNLLPVVMLCAFISFMGFTLSPVSISAIIIVLSVGVDDTIHFFTKFSRFSRHSDSNVLALSRTLQFELWPITSTTVAIFFSMIVLAFSPIVTIRHMGLLIAIGLLFTYVSDVIANTALLSVFRIITAFDMLSFRYNAGLLRSAPVFQGFTKSEIKKAVLLSEVRHLESGAQLIKQGDPGNSMFIVLEGELDVRRDSKSIARLKPGNVVGEMAYFSEESRTADVFASGKVSLVVFNEQAQRYSMRFQKKMYLKLMGNVIHIIIHRLT